MRISLLPTLLIAIVMYLLPMRGYAQLPAASTGKIVRHTAFASQWVPERTVDVWLPKGYSTEKKYAVLYMHDGQMLYDSSLTWNRQEWGIDETLQRLMDDKKIQDCIVVGIWNTGRRRHAEYFPQAPFASLTKQQQEMIYNSYRSNGQSIFSGIPIASDLYLKFLTLELKPFVDKNYSTLSQREYTFIAGSSMGGLISLYAICEYPNVFGGAACLSTHWPGLMQMENNPVPAAFFSYMQKKLPDPSTHRLYFDHGTETLDSMYAQLQKQADIVLKAKGFTNKNWISLNWPGQDHSERSWRSRLAVPMEFLLRPNQ
ncbi:MAG: alpha/beta hydrolase [Sphingomonadales bacterium]|nr:alpha/beta hydrolase [Sphingomonadales bacterium]